MIINTTKYLAFALHSVILVLGFYKNIGSEILWILFSIFSLAILSFIWDKSIGISFKIFCALILLGLSLKTSVFVYLESDIFGTAVNIFLLDNSLMNKILVIINLAFFSIIMARFVSKKIGLFPNLNKLLINEAIPKFYLLYRIQIWITLLFFIIITNVLNFFYNFHVIGLFPKSYIWPLNSVVSTLINLGFSFFLCLFIWWDRKLNYKNLFQIFIISFESSVSSLSTLSRSILLFHQIPNFPLLFNKSNSKYFIIKSLIIVSLISIITLTSISYLRSIKYSVTDSSVSSTKYSLTDTSISSKIINFKDNFIASNINTSNLFFKRWIGVEGVINAITSSDLNILKTEISLPYLFSDQFEIYYTNISNSNYTNPLFKFRDLPGIVGFLSFSGSYFVLLAGVFLASTIIIIFDFLLNNFTKNLLLKYFFGMNVSYAISMFGIDIINTLKYLFVIVIMSIIAYLLQSNLYCKK